jgi:uncharacterized Zn-binding protein involved in type VI secretion
MPAAARKGDKIKQDAPHCHAPIHPAAPTPTPTPHPAMPLEIKLNTIPTVLIDGQEAAVVGSVSEICSLSSCVPNGPGVIALGSFTVFHCGMPAARVGDMTAHAGCVAPIPSPVGSVQSPGCTTVDIG